MGKGLITILGIGEPKSRMSDVTDAGDDREERKLRCASAVLQAFKNDDEEAFVKALSALCAMLCAECMGDEDTDSMPG